MKWILRGSRPGSRPHRRAQAGLRLLERLESRQLLTTAAYTFKAPNLAPLIHKPNSTAAMFNTLTGSLQGQIVIGPLNDLKAVGNVSSAAITPDQYVADVKSIVEGFEAAAQQVPGNRLLKQLVQLQGDALDAQTDALKKQLDDGLLSNTPRPGATSDYYSGNLVTVEHLTLSRPLWPYGTPLLAYINRTEQFQFTLNNAGSKLDVHVAATQAKAESASYLADIHLATLRRPGLGNYLSQQVNALGGAIDAAAQSGSKEAFKGAITTFTSTTYNKANGDGILGPRGAYGRHFIQPTTDNQLPAGVPTVAFADANTFAFGRYRGQQVTKEHVFHRNFSEAPQRFGRFVTTHVYPTSAAAIRGSALDQTFGPPPNEAFYVEEVIVKPPTNIPANHLYVGKVAPIYQGILAPRNTLYPGMGSQVLIRDTRNDGVTFTNQRTTGT